MKRSWFGLTFAAAACVWSVGCVGGRVAHNLPPSQRLLEPGPGVGGPGPGVIAPASASMPLGPMGPMGGGACMAGGAGMGVVGTTSQIAFLGVEGAEVAWDTSGQGMFDSAPLVMPGRQNFPQGAIYRLKLTNVPDRPGVELYPTIEVAPVTPRTDAFLAHSPIPIQFTDEDLDQVLSGNFVTKVIYLPDPEFQELALAGVAELVSTRLDPGVDPISEADRRGAILAILRIGNLDLQLPGQMMAMNSGDVQQAEYEEGQGYEGEYAPEYPEMSGAPMAGPACGPNGCGPGGCMVGGGYGGPQGMPTAGFAPQAIPPHLISGVGGPQYGMPHVGTPIGLPGPPHIPLGHGAGLTSHTIKNRTRVLMPPPVHKMTMTVKQRPGMDYPRPVNHVKVSENNRAPFKLFGGTLQPAGRAAAGRVGGALLHHKDGAEECYDESCPEEYVE